ncbi:hypothetical protein BBP40_009290 [Aspergillus hancockii]|nr:hypothetical protein BBP40_009290 [Aspergillus hancockii]
MSEKSSAVQAHSIRTSKADILMSIKPEHMKNIAAKAKNHEYRRYLLPSTVRHIWLYTTAPISRIEYVARVSHGRTPGEVPEDGGIGNADFNAGKKVSKYAYEILDLWRLNEPINLKLAIAKGFLKGPPQKYCWAPLVLLESCPLDRQDHVFQRLSGEPPAESRKNHAPQQGKKLSSPTGPMKISDFFAKK